MTMKMFYTASSVFLIYIFLRVADSQIVRVADEKELSHYSYQSFEIKRYSLLRWTSRRGSLADPEPPNSPSSYYHHHHHRHHDHDDSILSQLLENATTEWSFAHGQDLILLLGNTRSGKSTLALSLSDQDSQLYSVVDEGEGAGGHHTKGLKIVDRGSKAKTSNSSQSHTLYPELYRSIDNESIFCDVPGFYDTRGEDFIKFNDLMLRAVLQGAKRVKLLFVVSKGSIEQQQQSRCNNEYAPNNDFYRLLLKISKLIVNLDKYKNSVALVVKRFEANFSTDEARGYAEAMLTLMKKSSHIPGKIRQVLDIFLTGGRLAVWKEPNETGPLSQIPSIVDDKKEIRKLLHRLRYIKTEAFDFNYDA